MWLGYTVFTYTCEVLGSKEGGREGKGQKGLVGTCILDFRLSQPGLSQQPLV